MIDTDKISEFIQDLPDNNALLDYVVQFKDDLIDLIIPMVYDEIRILYPALKPILNQISDEIIKYGVIYKLMESESFIQLRNQVQYNDSNSSVSLSAKTEQYIQRAELMKQQFYSLLNGVATRSFLQTAWGETRSNSDTMIVDMLGVEDSLRLL